MLKFILDILSVPAVLIGLVSFIGLVAQKKGLSDVLKGSIKTVMGVLILGGGAGLAV
ncbi:MAG: PTS ascorbate transporter subunit IIC, partial [Selenomonas sp.]|nr:PTS ascorbate transporter subunit IIC [Selenomonas sp.]